MRNLWIVGLVFLALWSCKEEKSTEAVPDIVVTGSYEPDLKIIPISHATFVMEWDGTVFYIDPTGGASAFKNMPDEDVILVTDIHGDHMSKETLGMVRGEQTILIVPEAVNEKIKDEQSGAEVLHNDQSTGFDGFKVTAVPMYNLTEDRLKFHKKGRGNGYIIEKNGYRVYISGDTEDIPEMRALEDIDIAFVCMNLPYTMTVEQAASAVLEFTPNKVYPYHYRGTNGLSDVVAFKNLITSSNDAIEVVQLDWYSN